MSKESNTNNKSTKFLGFLDNLYTRIKGFYQEVCSKSKNLSKTNYDLGMFHMKNGNLSDAIMRFKLVIFMKGETGMLYYNLGRCYNSMDKQQKAEEALLKSKSFALDPVQIMLVDYELAHLNASKYKPPAFIPLPYVAEYFDNLARDLKSGTIAMPYYGESMIIRTILAEVGSNELNMLDLGSGFGRIAEFARKKLNIAKITAIDISKEMANYANELMGDSEKVYDIVLNTDFTKYLPTVEEKFDLITAIESFSYLGDLTSILKHCANALESKGHLVLSLPLSNAKQFHLDKSLEFFTYSKEYLQTKLEEAGFTHIMMDELNINEDTIVIECICLKQ